MILQISSDMSRVAFQIEAWGRQLIDWDKLELVIEAAECEPKPLCCKRPHVPGSPWVLTGCWPGHWTGIDIANFRAYDLPDYRPLVIPAYGLDNDGRVVFLLMDEPFKALPYGRYAGSIRVRHTPPPQMTAAYNLASMVHVLHEGDRAIPPEYGNCCDTFPFAAADLGPKHCTPKQGVLCPPGMCPPPKRDCILAEFDIDYGPGCSDHIVRSVVADFHHPTGGIADGDS